MPDAQTDLTHAADIELDAALQIGFRRYAQAKTADDHDAQHECHEATMLVLAEQGRRLDGWLDHTLGVSS